MQGHDMADHRNYKRRQFVVNRKLQYSLLAITVTYFLIILLIVAAALFVPLFLSLNDKSLDAAQRSMIAEITLYIHARFWPAFIAVSIILACHSIFTSHKIAGPLYRFRVFFRKMIEGDFSTPMEIRKHDYLHEEKQIINEMINMLNSKLRCIQSEQATLQDMLKDFIAKHKTSLNTETIKELLAIEEHLHRLQNEVDYFNL